MVPWHSKCAQPSNPILNRPTEQYTTGKCNKPAHLILIFLLFFYSKTQWDASGPSQSEWIYKDVLCGIRQHTDGGNANQWITSWEALPTRPHCAAFARRRFRRCSLGGAPVRRAAGETGRVVTANISLRLITIITHRRLDALTATRNLLAVASAVGASEQDLRKGKLKLSSTDSTVWVQSGSWEESFFFFFFTLTIRF